MTKFDPRSCTYQEALENFDQFCDYFDAAARTPRPTENNPGGSPVPDIALQKPQLMYKPPHRDEYIKITEFLDNVEERLLKLEKDSHKAPRTNHGERLTKLEEKINGISSTDL